MTVGYQRAEPSPTPNTPTDHNIPPRSTQSPKQAVKRAVERLGDVVKAAAEAAWSGRSGCLPVVGGLLHVHLTSARVCTPRLYYCGVVQGLPNANSIK